MPDIRLISILPPQTVTGVQQVSPSQGAPAHAGPVSSLSPGTVLNGFIVNRDASGNPVLRTPSGDVTFSSNFFLKIGSEVSIRVENSPAGTSAHILSVDGQPPEIAETLSGFASATDTVSQSLTQNPAAEMPLEQPTNLATPQAAVASSATPAPSPAITVTGTLISPPPADPAQPQAPASLPVGTQFSLKITTLAFPTPTGSLAVQTNPAAAAPLATPASYNTYARASGALPTSVTAAVATQTTAAPTALSPAEVVTPTTAPQTTTENTATSAAVIPAAEPQVATAPTAPATAPVAANTAEPVANNAAVISTAQPAPPQPAVTTATPPPIAIQPPAVTSTVSTTTPITNTTPSTTIPQTGQSVSATVIGNEPTGESVLQTTIGVVRLQPGTLLPTGSSVTFEISDITPPPATISTNSASTAAAATPLTGLARQWAGLQDIAGLLASRDALTGLDALQSPIPTIPTVNVAAFTPLTAITPQTISSGLMVFISALRGNDFRSWLGKDNVQWLNDHGHDALVKKVEGEFLGMAKQFGEPQPHQWQPLFFPVAVGNEMRQARLFVKRDRKQGGNAQQQSKNEDTRFVVEMDLTQLGEMQMDGFVRRREQNVQFDLIIRSLTPLSSEAQKDILQIYNDAGELTGYKGSIAFQAVKEFPVNPMEEIVAHGMDAVTA